MHRDRRKVQSIVLHESYFGFTFDLTSSNMSAEPHVGINDDSSIEHYVSKPELFIGIYPKTNLCRLRRMLLGTTWPTTKLCQCSRQTPLSCIQGCGSSQSSIVWCRCAQPKLGIYLRGLWRMSEVGLLWITYTRSSQLFMHIPVFMAIAMDVSLFQSTPRFKTVAKSCTASFFANVPRPEVPWRTLQWHMFSIACFANCWHPYIVKNAEFHVWPHCATQFEI